MEAHSTPPSARRVYVMDVKADGLMTTGDARLGMAVKGRKEAEHICRQLERRYGKKFYLEDFLNPKKT
jgi:hypothetical protein